MSARASVFRRRISPGRRALEIGNRRLRNALPSGTTCVACTRCPIRDWNWWESRTQREVDQWARRRRSCSSLWRGRLTVNASKISSIPRKDMQVEGPSILSRARGTPSSRHVLQVIWKARLHSCVLGDPKMRKSSK